MPYDCPTPDKVRYATRAGAEQGAHRASLRFGEPLYPYECACTWWHVSKSEPEPDVDMDAATRADIECLAAAPDADFRAVVVADATGTATPAQRAALRHHTNLYKWKYHLGQLMHDVQTQLHTRARDATLATHDWRRRTLGYRNTLRIRATECKRLRAAEHAVVTASRTESRRRDLEAAQRAGASVKTLRAKAGEVAVSRLVDSHGPEFARLLEEEYAALGLTLPENVARHLAAEAAP